MAWRPEFDDFGSTSLLFYTVSVRSVSSFDIRSNGIQYQVIWIPISHNGSDSDFSE